MMQLALLEIARHDAEVTTQVCRRILGGVETELRLLVAGIRAVALEAAVGDDGADVAVEIDFRRCGGSGHGYCGGSDEGDAHY